MNHNPLWKYLLIVAVLLAGFIYAFPNLYPADPSLQISSNGTAGIVDDFLRDRIDATLQANGLKSKSTGFEEEYLMVRFDDTDTQLAAYNAIATELGSSYITAQNLAATTPGWLRALNAGPMNLGLDLRGGVHFLLQIDTDEVMKTSLSRFRGDISTTLRKADAKNKGTKVQDGKMVVAFNSEADRDVARGKLKSAFVADLEFTDTVVAGLPALSGVVLENKVADLKRAALRQNISALRKRVNELGVAEPVIQQQGLDRIVVQLPGVQDTARAKKIIGTTATLEFRFVNEEDDQYLAQRTGKAPTGYRLFKERNGSPILLKRRTILTGEYIIDASSGIDQEGGSPNVTITLDGKGAQIMSEQTSKNVKKLMAVVFIEFKPKPGDADKVIKVEEVINVARIQETLSKRFQITGLDSMAEAADLALLLRAGALAAPMQFVEERTVGPSLGKANIEQGFKSVVFGFILVVIFMAVYYRVFGLVANFALFMNLVLIIAVLSLLQATLTLPGIAGIVLTVGMAVDANVLIFERIREELRSGNTPHGSIDAGYNKAFSTIADANITTLIAALVLFLFGTGPIKGFAITLSIGIVSSMFTAIIVSRVIINLVYGRKRVKSLAI